MFGNASAVELARKTSQTLEEIVKVTDKKFAETGKILSELARLRDDDVKTIGDMIMSVAKRGEEEFSAIHNAITALEERLDRLETAVEKPLNAFEENPFPERSTKGADMLSVIGNDALIIEYTSSSRKTTKRTVQPRQAVAIQLNGQLCIDEFSAFCTLRMSIRTFVVSRIDRAFDAKTGEEVDTADWIMARVKK